jgi:spermidine/putrescine transport system permease protein
MSDTAAPLDQAVRYAREAEVRDVRTRWLLALPAVIVVMLAAVGPLLVVVIYSFLTPGDYAGVKWEFSIDSWIGVVLQRDIFDDTLQWADAHLTIFWRSVSLAIMATLLTLFLGFPTAYFIATRPRSSRNTWLFLITIPFWANLLVRTFAILELIRNEGVINTFLRWIGVIDEPIQILFTDFAIGLGMFYVYLPLMVLPLYASIEKLDFRLVEASYDLYANRWKTLTRVILPLVKPGIVAGSILVFIPSLGAYVVPRVLGGGKNMMLGNLIDLQFGQGRNWPLGAALSITLMAIVMIALLFYVRNVGKSASSHG